MEEFYVIEIIDNKYFKKIFVIGHSDFCIDTSTLYGSHKFRKLKDAEKTISRIHKSFPDEHPVIRTVQMSIVV